MKLEVLTGLLTGSPLPIEDALLLTTKILNALQPWTIEQKLYGYLTPDYIEIDSELTNIKLLKNSEARKQQGNNAKKYRYQYIAPEQTGRINRTVDYRADFYSLGIILYELLTGKKPFETTDVLELVHCHLAKTPLTPTQVFPDIPQMVSAIVMKLLAKSADERYQSCKGIFTDLDNCLVQFNDKGEVEPFKLGQRDISDRFIIPQKLYGREEEVDRYLNVFSQVCNGSRALMLVSGYSGCGKSALVHEIYKPLTLQRGYFISGKFDQFARNIPYSAVIAAFTQLMQQILTESNERLVKWKNKIIKTLGTNAQVIIDVIPDVEMVIGPQPTVAELGSTETNNRFNLVFQNFIQVFCEAEHPLVIFLDDLQWVDSASIKLIELMITDTQNHHLFLVGAYRDNEVSSTHPLIITIEQLKKSKLIIEPLELSPLKSTDIIQLLSDTFHTPENEVASLAQLIMQKTSGNPFFVKQFLRSIHEDGLLTFNPDQIRWQWNIKQLEDEKITDNVVELMIGRLKKLPSHTQNVLKLAACLGNTFNTKTLSVVYGKTIGDSYNDLFPSIQLGLIQYKNIRGSKNTKPLDKEQNIQFRFLHDRVQQAANAMIADKEKPQLHLEIGRLLLEQYSKTELELHLFEVVDHINQGNDSVSNREERIEIAKLNLDAAQKAKSSLAYEAGLKYAKQGLSYLPKNSWDSFYHLTLALYLEKGELEYLNTLWDEAIATFDHTYDLTTDLLNRCKISEYKATLYRMKNDLQMALDTGIQALAELGIKIKAYPTVEELLTEIENFRPLIENRGTNDLFNLPELEDPLKLSAMALLRECFAPAYFLGSNLIAIIGIKMTEITLKHGNSSHSSVGYIFYSSITLAVSLNDYENAFRFGQLSLKLNDEKYHIKAYEALIYDMFGTFVSPYKEPIPVARNILMQGYYSGLENGSYQWAGYCAIISLFQSFWGPDTLSEVSDRIERISPGLQKIDQNMLQYYYAVKATIFNLTEPNRQWEVLSESIWHNSTEILKTCRRKNDLLTLFVDAVCHLSLANWYNSPLKAVEYTKLAEKYLAGAPGIYLNPVFHFHRALAFTTAYHLVDACTQKSFLKSINEEIILFKSIAQSCPVTYSHHLLLIQAEYARITGDNWKAVEYYDKAINSSIDNKFVQDAAYANELAAMFWMSKNNNKIADTYFKEAHRYYMLWGATGKISDLANNYPEIFPQPATPTDIGSINHEQLQGSLSLLDLYSVIKAAHVISGEIVFSQLLEKMIRIVVENAGAQYGALFLVQNENLALEAEFDFKNNSANVRNSTSIDKHIAQSVINYVMRTKESVVLHDAAHEGVFTKDPYIKNNNILSVLAIPLIHQGIVSGILYLENNLSKGIFTSERIQVTSLLASQAGTSIENAKLFKERDIAVNRLISEQNFINTAIDTFLDTFFVFDLATNKAVKWNKAFTEISEYSDSEIKDLKAPDTYYSKEDLKKAYSTINQLIHNGKAMVEMGLVTKSKKIIPTEYTSGIINNEKGEPQYVISIGRNITERKKAEKEIALKNNEIAAQNEEYLTLNEELIESNTELLSAKNKIEESELEFRVLYNNSPDMYASVAPENASILMCNDTLLKNTGYKREEILGLPIFSIYHESCLNEVNKTFEEFRETGTITDKELTLKRKDGSKIQVNLNVNSVKDSDGKVIYSISSCRDITEQNITKQELINAKEKAEESDRLKTEFINNMSHEIRTPMNGILGFSNFLNKPDLSEAKRKYYISIIQNSGNQLMRIIDDIIEISKLGTKQVKISEKEICLNDLLLKHFSFFDIKAKENKTPLYLKKGLRDKYSFVLTDETKLNTVLSNLLENAIKFTNDGFIEFGYQLKTDTKPSEIEFFVKDTGIGIAPDKHDVIFERFSQEEKDLSKNVGGLGLGLSIAKENTELLGGKISLQSEKGKGASFFVSIPYKPVNTPITEIENSINEIEDNKDLHTVLIAEDEEINYLYLETLLEEQTYLNCKILHAKNGQEAVNICKTNKKVDLVFMDLKMPIMNGFEATKQIKTLNPNLPVIAQTAYISIDDQNKAFSAGCIDYISKPIDKGILNETIKKHIKTTS